MPWQAKARRTPSRMIFLKLIRLFFADLCIGKRNLVHVFINTITYMVELMGGAAQRCIHRRGAEDAERNDFYVCR